MRIWPLFRALHRSLVAVSIRPLLRRLGGDTGVIASVILYTHNRATYLNLALATLERQMIPQNGWEIIVADNASQDATSEILEVYETRKKLRIRRIRSEEPVGRASLLNKALEIARGQIIIFLGDDQLVQPDFLVRHLLLHLDESCVVIGDSHRLIMTHLFAPEELEMDSATPNPCIAPRELKDPRKMANLIFPGDNSYEVLLTYLIRQHGSVPMAWAYFTTLNASVAREALHHYGGFDERLSGWGIEDIEFAYRLHQFGMNFRFAPQAVSLKQQTPARIGIERELLRDITNLFCKYPRMSHMEREIIRRGRYVVRD